MSHHRLPDHLLSEYVSGSIDADFEVLITSHLTLSSASREDLKLHQDIGGLLLSQLPTETTNLGRRTIPERLLSMLDSASSAESAVGLPDGDSILPRPLINYLLEVAGTAKLSELEWYSYYTGIDRAFLTEGPDGVRARILRCQPGASFPVHGHGSEEVSLVLQGAYSDETGRYGRGDVQCVPAEKSHGPVVEADEICYVLVVSELPAIWLGDSNSA